MNTRQSFLNADNIIMEKRPIFKNNLEQNLNQYFSGEDSSGSSSTTVSVPPRHYQIEPPKPENNKIIWKRKKRKCNNKPKTWSKEEIKKLLSYVQAHRDIEKPSARVYYNKLVEETKIKATWIMMKSKLRHLRGTLEKALAYCNSTGANAEDATTLTDICPHYEQLSNIFLTVKDMKVVLIELTNHDEMVKRPRWIWRDESVKKMLTYIQAHRYIEEPTARLYYNKLMEETKIDATWTILKDKVRGLKRSLERAVVYFNSIGANEKDTTLFKDTVLHICPHYEQLSDIFPTVKDTNVTVKRKRGGKRYDENVKKLLTYMQAHRNIEEPTARQYCKKLIKETKINATWISVKNKLIFLKRSLERAVVYCNSKGANEKDTTLFKDTVLHICPHYEQLSDIFPTLVKGTKFAIMDTTTEVSVMDTTTQVSVMDTTTEFSVTDTTTEVSVMDTTTEVSVMDTMTQVSGMDTTIDVFDNRSQDATDLEENNEEPTISFADTTSATQNQQLPVMDTGIKLTNFQEKQHELEKEKFEWAKEVENKKLELEREKLSNELQLKKLELEHNERIRMTNFKEKQHDLEKEKFEWAKEVENKKLDLEREKLSNELQLKKLELEQNERIKMTNFQEKQHEWANEVENKKLEMEREKLSNEFQLKKLELEHNERIQISENIMKYKKIK